MKKMTSVILLVTILFSSLGITSSHVFASTSNLQNTNMNNSLNLETPIDETFTENSERAIPLWVAWILGAVGGAILDEIVSDVYSVAQNAVINAWTNQGQNYNPNTKGIYDINMYGDKFRADLTANYVGDGRANNATRVSTLQRALKERGFNPGTIDGVWGANTKSAVKQFQASISLTADGIVGKDIWSKLQKK